MERVPRSIAERRIFVDTSAFLALVATNDRYHHQSVQILSRLQRGRYRLLTSRYVVVETHAAILSAVSGDAARVFLRRLAYGGVAVVPTENRDEVRAEEIVFQYQDKDYSLCDAISFAVMERLGLSLAFAFDGHFRQHGFSSPLDRPDWPS